MAFGLSSAQIFWFRLLVSPKSKRVQGKPSNNALYVFGTNKSDADRKPTRE